MLKSVAATISTMAASPSIVFSPFHHRLTSHGDVDHVIEPQILPRLQRQRKLTYINTTSRITSGELLKERNELAGLGGRGMRRL